MASRRRTAGASGSVIIVTIVAVLGYTYWYVSKMADVMSGRIRACKRLLNRCR